MEARDAAMAGGRGIDQQTSNKKEAGGRMVGDPGGVNAIYLYWGYLKLIIARNGNVCV